MRAIVQDVYGSADVLRLAEIDPPTCGPGEVLIRVKAAGVDPGVWHVMTGTPVMVRAMGFGLRRPKVPVRGRDVAGVVEAVGADVKRLAVGDEVYGTTDTGSFAEYATAPERLVARKPASLTFEQAAVLPISGVTALQGVRDSAAVQPGQQVLVIGAAGGVGAFAVQIATAMGASVTAVCSGPKADFVRSLGAVDVIDYTQEEITSRGPRFDVVIDTAGNRSLSRLRSAMTSKGTLVIVGGEAGGGPMGGFERQLIAAPLVSLMSSQRLVSLMAKEGYADLDALTALVDAGSLTPVVSRTYPLAEAPDAIRHLAEGHAQGKVAVTI